MNYKEWSTWIESRQQRGQQTGCVFQLGYYIGLFVFIATKGFLYAFGAWVFLKMIGVTL